MQCLRSEPGRDWRIGQITLNSVTAGTRCGDTLPVDLGEQFLSQAGFADACFPGEH